MFLSKVGVTDFPPFKTIAVAFVKCNGEIWIPYPYDFDINEDGWLSSIIEGKERIYEIKLTNRSDNYIITAHNADKSENISYDDARRILKHIISAYGSSVARN